MGKTGLHWRWHSSLRLLLVNLYLYLKEISIGQYKNLKITQYKADGIVCYAVR